MIDREELALPWRFGGLELVRYGGVMLQLKSDHGYVLTFTPQSNEFTITLMSSSTTGHTAGLCGNRNQILISFYQSNNTAAAVMDDCCAFFLQAPVARRRLMSSLCVMAARPPTSLPSSQTGPRLQTGVCVCPDGRPCVCPEQRWDVRPCAPKCLNRAMSTSPSRCSWPSARSRRVRSQMCAS